MAESLCPLCEKFKHMRRSKLLYGTPVCRKCYYQFANRRQLAYVADWIAFQFVAYYISLGLGFVYVYLSMSQQSIDIAATLMFWIGFPFVFYLKDGFGGHSLGKLVAGVQVTHPDSFEPIGFASSFKRNLPLIIPFMPLCTAFLLQKGYRLGDGWAKSKVIWKRYATHPVFTGMLACEECHYDLTGNTTGICPECGTLVSDRNKVLPSNSDAPAAPPTTPSLPSA